MSRRIHLWISGRVQGVFYRASAEKQARALGLNGWARNLADGRVELVAEGGTSQIDTLLNWCRRGPPLARVEDMTVVEEPVSGEFTGFQVRRDY
jgi:acylphosphatase